MKHRFAVLLAIPLIIAAPTISAQENSVGHRLRGVQHFGVTVGNMERAYEFYTKVLGGTEVLRDGDFMGADIQNALMQVDDLDAKERKVNPRSIGIPDLRSGRQRLDVVFIQFDNVVIELLQYRDENQKKWAGGTYAATHPNTAPAIPTNMHISFYVKDDADFDQFIADLEAAAKARGMTNVRCNRNTDAETEQARLAAPKKDNALEITSGVSNGWALAYCKGPEGEQLEFNQVKAPIKGIFEKAKEKYLRRSK